jgi:hypothetical protein
VTTDLRSRLDAALGDDPPHRPVPDRVAAGRRALRRRRRRRTAATVALTGVAGLALVPLLLGPATGGGGGIDGPTPRPTPTGTPHPGHVRLLVAPARYVTADTPPVLYLFGRMFRRDQGVDVLAAYGEIDVSEHPQGGAIVRVDGRTQWVLVAGNEPERLVEERFAPYDYGAFSAWAATSLAVLSGRLALAATAPGPFTPPVPDSAAPASFAGGRLVARPGGTVVERVRHPVVDERAVSGCPAQAVRVRTSGGDWFVLGSDCQGRGALYSERVGVRADTLAAWLVQVKRAQDAFVR